MYPTLLHETQPTARREHECSCCGRVIEKGEKYLRQDNIFEDRRYAYKACAHCSAAMERALDLCTPWDEGITYESIEATLFDYHESVADLRMLVQLRRRWRRSDGTLFPVPAASKRLGREE